MRSGRLVARILLYCSIPATVLACRVVLGVIADREAMRIDRPLPATLPARYRVSQFKGPR